MAIKIPNPKLSSDVMEKFISGEKPNERINDESTVKLQKEDTNDYVYQKKSAKAVRMYNVPFPLSVHRQAKLNAYNEGISLVEYLIRAVAEANEHYKAKAYDLDKDKDDANEIN